MTNKDNNPFLELENNGNNPFLNPFDDGNDDNSLKEGDNGDMLGNTREFQGDFQDNNVEFGGDGDIGGAGVFGGGDTGGNNLESGDAKDLLSSYVSNNRTLDKLVSKIASKFVFRKSSLKPTNKIDIEDILNFDEFKKGKINIKITNLSTTYIFDPSAISGDDDFYKTTDGSKKEISKLTQEIWKENDIKNDIKYILPITEGEFTVVHNKSVDKKKLWRIWKQHDKTYNIYIGDIITGKKESKLNKIHENENEVVVEVADMMKNVGIWGQMGSGKSVLIRGLLNSAIAKSENMFNFLILEKETDFVNYFKFKNVLFNDAVGNMNIERIYSLFVYLALEYKKRNKLFNELGAAHLRAYNEKVSRDKRLPLLILLIDEYKELRDTLKKQSKGKLDLDKSFGESLGGLLQVSRASGILAWVATQQATEKRGIHLGVRNNLSTGFVGTTIDTIEGRRFSALTTIQRRNLTTINKGDFYTFGTIGKNLIRCPFWDAGHIDDPEFYTKMPLKENWEEFREANYIREYSNQYIVDTIEKIAKELEINKFNINYGLYQSYHVPTGWVEGLRGLKKLAIILFLNLFLEWFNKSREIVLNTTNIPEEFDLDAIVTGLKSNSDYKAFSLLFDYMLYLYELNYADFIKQNFKFSSKKRIIEEGSEEEKEQLASFFTQKVMDMMDYKLKDINFGD